MKEVQRLVIPEGEVERVSIGGIEVWRRRSVVLVSLGDSIAAGHTINSRWETDYGVGSQYGENGNTRTAIVPGSYTDLLRNELAATYGAGRVSAASFAHSGDTVADLLEKLSHETVRKTLAKADVVTVCIGANDVLQPALSNLGEYISAGDAALNEIAATVERNMATLSDDSSPASYRALFDRLHAINPNAKYVFTTIYNPYKYLWLDEGQNGFLGPVLSVFSGMSILGFDIGSLIQNGILGTSAVQTLYARVNGLCDWAERYVSALNQVLRAKIDSYQAVNPNFSIADTKLLFEAFPDRPYSASRKYNDLVNVEYTRGYDTMQMDWGNLWGDSAWDYCFALASRYVSLSGLDINGLATEFVEDIVEKVIVPDVDPHPEEYGQYVLKRSFADALGWASLDRYDIAYAANGGGGSMPVQTVAGVDGLPVFVALKPNAFGIPATGYYFTGWNTAANGSGAAYASGQVVSIAANTTLHAQWSNVYVINVHHSEDSVIHGSSDTGPQEKYALWIDGVEQPDLGAFSNGSRVYNLPYGSQVGVIAQTETGSARSYITLNDVKIAGNSDDARYGFTVTSHMDIHFQWNYWLDGISPQSYWNCYVTTY